MTTSVAVTRENANQALADSRNLSPRNAETNGVLADCCRAVFGRKTWAQLSEITGLSERSAKGRLAREREFTVDELRALLQSENGIHFLVALMADARPAWWSALLRMGVLGGIAKRRAADLRLLRRVADADRSTAATIPASLLVQDADFYEPVLAAFDAVARASDSTMDRPSSATSRGNQR